MRPGYIHPKTWTDGVMPLAEFPGEKQEEIARAVAGRTPPRRWLQFAGCRMETRAWHEWHWSRGLRLHRDHSYRPVRRRRISDELRAAVYRRDGWACLHCGTPENLSLDHIHPHSLGGEDVLENLQTLCRSCNSRKGARI